MKKESKEERQKQILEKAMEVRTRELEERALIQKADPTPEELGDMYERLCQRIRDNGLADEEGNPTAKAMTRSKTMFFESAWMKKEEERKRRRRTGRKIVKAAGIVLVAGSCVFGFSMTSEANRMFWMKQVERVRNAGKVTQIDNDDFRDFSKNQEEYAKKTIKEELQITIPEFYYWPEEIHFYRAEVFIENKSATFEYRYGEKCIYFSVYASSKDLSLSDAIKEDEETIEIKTLDKDENIDVKIKDLTDNNNAQCTASWEYKNGYYLFGGAISKEEVIKILKKMQYNV